MTPSSTETTSTFPPSDDTVIDRDDVDVSTISDETDLNLAPEDGDLNW
ncbi:NFU domain protein 1 [Actinidia rufa]|uniref:NFU domain protein 1 n=1 Tax=Actinidia rufa TaxID=165716 RepID=A0A7J0GS60_9ERIC|nr:NFU domain protein 1 [Actinidia rufa]